MKKVFIILCLLFAASFTLAPAASAQITVNINIGKQPGWGPAGYDFVRFYYFPELNIYYDVDHGLFYVHSGNRWRTYTNLPRRYRRYDLYTTYKVVINTERPWMHNSIHVRDYSRYRGNRSQVVIRDSRDARYNSHPSRTRPQASPSRKQSGQIESRGNSPSRSSGTATGSRGSGNNRESTTGSSSRSRGDNRESTTGGSTRSRSDNRESTTGSSSRGESRNRESGGSRGGSESSRGR